MRQNIIFLAQLGLIQTNVEVAFSVSRSYIQFVDNLVFTMWKLFFKWHWNCFYLASLPSAYSVEHSQLKLWATMNLKHYIITNIIFFYVFIEITLLCNLYQRVKIVCTLENIYIICWHAAEDFRPRTWPKWSWEVAILWKIKSLFISTIYEWYIWN